MSRYHRNVLVAILLAALAVAYIGPGMAFLTAQQQMAVLALGMTPIAVARVQIAYAHPKAGSITAAYERPDPYYDILRIGAAVVAGLLIQRAFARETIERAIEGARNVINDIRAWRDR